MPFDPAQYARQTLIRHAQDYAARCSDTDPHGRLLGAAFREVGRELAASAESARTEGQ